MSLRTIGRAVTHVVHWVDYHARAGAHLSECPATLTVYDRSEGGPLP